MPSLFEAPAMGNVTSGAINRILTVYSTAQQYWYGWKLINRIQHCTAVLVRLDTD
jgi:hypothetical protein